jgi:hypothetical protein
VECPTQRQPNVGVAVPAEIDDGSFECEQVERALEAHRCRARVHDEIETIRRVVRQGEVDAEG